MKTEAGIKLKKGMIVLYYGELPAYEIIYIKDGFVCCKYWSQLKMNKITKMHTIGFSKGESCYLVVI